MGPAEVLKNLPGKDPGTKFEPSAWTGTIQGRVGEEEGAVEKEPKDGNVEGRKDTSSEEGYQAGQWTGKVAQR